MRRRQDRGLQQIVALFPDLMTQEDRPRLGWRGSTQLATRNPVGSAVYAAVALALRLADRRQNRAGAGSSLPDWKR